MNRGAVLAVAWLAFVALVPAVAANGLPAFDRRAFAPDEAARLLLVTFPLQAANRLPVGPRAIRYQPRGYGESTLDRRLANALARDHALEHVAAWPVRALGVHCVVMRVSDARPLTEVVAAVAADPRTNHAQAMHRFDTRAAPPRDPYFDLQTNLHHLRLDALHAATTGRGVRVAVIDTGADLAHPDLAGQFDDHANFVAAISPGFEQDRHGTAIAGIVAAKAGNDTGIVGVAPDARLLAYKACWSADAGDMAAICNSFSLALAVDTALRADVDVINLSLTGPYDALLAALLDAALARGIVVVAADDGDAAETSFPASLPGVVGVRTRPAAAPAAVDTTHLVVPGEEILSTLPRGTYDFLSGSSFSAAQVTGLAALARVLAPRLSGTRFAAALGAIDHALPERLLALRAPR